MEKGIDNSEASRRIKTSGISHGKQRIVMKEDVLVGRALPCWRRMVFCFFSSFVFCRLTDDGGLADLLPRWRCLALFCSSVRLASHTDRPPNVQALIILHDPRQHRNVGKKAARQLLPIVSGGAQASTISLHTDVNSHVFLSCIAQSRYAAISP